MGAITRMIWVGTVKRPWDWKYRLVQCQRSPYGESWDVPRYSVECVGRQTNGSILEIYGSKVSDVGLLMQKE